jgi:hypothetical protein
MPALFLRTLFLCLILSSFSKLSLAVEDKPAVCKVLYDAARESLLADFKKLETDYLQYRWTEMQIRLLTYEKLWKARVESLDPLSKEMRAGGNHEEDRLLKILEGLDQESKDYSNAFWKSLGDFKRYSKSFQACCPEKNYGECMDGALRPVFAKIETGKVLFDGIFERERDYRKEVELTAGSRKGLYPEDAIEEEALHGDYFKRYEMERRGRRFEDDKEMAYYFQEVKKMLTDSFPGDVCCQACGKTAWEAKVDAMFNEA